MKIKFGIIVAFVLAGVLSLTACSSVEGLFSKKDKEEPTTVETTTAEETTTVPEIVEIDSVFSYNGKKIELPVSYQQFAQQFDYVMKPDSFSDYDENTKLDTNSYFMHYDYDNDMTLTIANMSSSAQAIKDCDIIGIQLEFDRTNTFDYHGLSWDSSADDIVACLGKPQSTYSSEEYEYIDYILSDDRDCDFDVSFSLKKGNLSSFEIGYSYWDMNFQTIYDFGEYDFPEEETISDIGLTESDDDLIAGLFLGDTCMVEEADLQITLPSNWEFTTEDDETMSASSLLDGTNVIMQCFNIPSDVTLTKGDLDEAADLIIDSVGDNLYSELNVSELNELPFATDFFSARILSGKISQDIAYLDEMSQIYVDAVHDDCLIQFVITAFDTETAMDCLNMISNISNTF